MKSVPLYAQNEKTPPQATAMVDYWGSIDDLTNRCKYARMINPTNVTVLGNVIDHRKILRFLMTAKSVPSTHEDYDHFCFGDVDAPLIIYSGLSQQNSLAGILSHPIETNPEVSANSVMSVPGLRRSNAIGSPP